MELVITLAILMLAIAVIIGFYRYILDGFFIWLGKIFKKK